MGYTHYWRNDRDLNLETWESLIKDVKKLIDKSDVPIGNWDGEAGSQPEISQESINFNGIGDDSYENLRIVPQQEKFAFCKTAHKPYDKIVVGVLCLFKIYFPHVIVSSDGQERDWKEGIDNLNTILKINCKYSDIVSKDV